ncbi:hypothetical protein OAS86_05515 [Gammaproteobacteria bacterium]|nr:hypothetical protein [Gammaproteobacteria bacterium]
MNWQALDNELARWQADNLRARLWWRDDDAVADTPALRRLLTLSTAHRIPLALAVIPALADATLAPTIDSADNAHRHIRVLQHGFNHHNNVSVGRKCELDDERPPERVIAQLHEGLGRLDTLFGERLLSVLVPPWNRIGSRLASRLPTMQPAYRALSLIGDASPLGLPVVNVHLDLLNFRQGRFRGEEELVGSLIDALQHRRLHHLNAPIGLMSHHRVHDADCWAFLAILFDRYASHPAINWCAIEQLIPANNTANLT